MSERLRYRREYARHVTSTLSDRDLSVIATLANVRLATTTQIQQLIFSTGSQVSASRRCSRVLRRLTNMDIITVVTQRHGGASGGQLPHCYRLGLLGQRIAWPDRLRYPDIRPLGREYVAHLLASTQIYVAIHRAANSGLLTIRQCQTEPSCWRGRLKPDMYVLIHQRRVTRAWFLEIDLASEAPTRIRAKCEQYYRYWTTGREQACFKLFPRVLFLVPDRIRLAQIEREIRARPDYMRAMFVVCLQTDAISTITGGTSL